jgi:MbtH protein
MDEAGQEDTHDYLIVRNEEEQYSIWRADRPVPAGWETAGGPAPKAQCLERIAEVWTDMRPRSLRLAMDSATG